MLWSTTVAMFFAGAILGSLCINCVADQLGRKMGIIVTNSVVFACTASAMASYWVSNYKKINFTIKSLIIQ